MRNIILLENSKTIYLILKKNLETILGASVNLHFVKTHEDFISTLHGLDSVDVVFMNKGVNNLNLVRALNRSKYYKGIPLILLTSNLEEEMEGDIKVNDILLKPFSEELLQDALERL